MRGHNKTHDLLKNMGFVDHVPDVLKHKKVTHNDNSNFYIKIRVFNVK